MKVFNRRNGAFFLCRDGESFDLKSNEERTIGYLISIRSAGSSECKEAKEERNANNEKSMGMDEGREKCYFIFYSFNALKSFGSFDCI